LRLNPNRTVFFELKTNLAKSQTALERLRGSKKQFGHHEDEKESED